ncbi:MAG: M20/M25/M40 family metallo-hydrolase [Campylobacterota bacterium]|nr:M20/M25/M40 family metallo-hydrolase [Campylobacterota bacterium]
MSSIIQYFKTLTQIPHCSKEADKLLEFLILFGRERGYEVSIDSAKNILISKGNPKLCLQAHYDMVCMGRAPEIKTYEEDGWLKAEESSLGADNGIAIAMMMSLMDEGEELEFLLTSDEEIGLIGANALSFTLQSYSMLNLDSEDEAEVYIGCAGGADVTASKNDLFIEGRGTCYEVSVRELPGGHSGVDIDKGIPSAIKVLGSYLHGHQVTQLVSLYAGERRNSIPANAVAIVYAEEPFQDTDLVKTRELREQPKVLKEGFRIIELIEAFRHGVQAQNEVLGIPDVSINLAIIATDEKGGITIESSARAMSSEGLESLIRETVDFFESYGFQVEVEDKYPSWKPEVNSFTELVSDCVAEVFGQSKMMAIHAGLECGVIREKYPTIKLASIGPTIRYPHSTREKVKIDSVEKTFGVLKRVITRAN